MRRVLRTITALCKALCLRKFAILPERLDHRVGQFVHG